MFSRLFSRNNFFLKIRHLKRFIFFSPWIWWFDQASKPTMIVLNRWFKFSGFGRDWGPQRGFGCFPVVDLSFFCLLCPWVFKNFLVSALDYPFRVFTLKSHFFHFLFIFSSHHAFENSKFIPNEWMIYQDDFGWRTKTTTLMTMKNSPRKNLFSLSIHIESKWTF